jgi:hypothetical protein
MSPQRRGDEKDSELCRKTGIGTLTQHWSAAPWPIKQRAEIVIDITEPYPSAHLHE